VRNANRCTFHAEEAGRSVGLPSPWGCAAQPYGAQAEKHVAPPPIGTPPAQTHPGNSAPARAPVAGLEQSPGIGPGPAGCPALAGAVQAVGRQAGA
jgi:hypothetical protein